jgi:hypothetical protein
MQSNGPLAASSQELNIAVSPETNVVPPNVWHPVRQQITKICLLLIALAIAAVTARASEGTLTFSPSSLSVGNVAIETSHSTAVTVKNTGTAAVTITGESVHAGEFSISGLTTGTTIAAGASATLTIKFSPTSTGLSAGYITIASSATNSYVQYSVNGTGVHAGELVGTPSSVNFGSVPIGSKNTQTVQLKNTGAVALTISSDSLSGTGFSVQELATSPAVTLGAGQTTSFTMAFAPTSSGSTTGSLTIKSTAANSTLTIALGGTGVSTARAISLSSSTLNFGNEVVGGTSTLEVAVKNTGNSSLTVSTISVSGSGFSVGSGVAGATIAAGQTAELKVMFAPKVAGSVSGKVTIASNASVSPSAITVEGTGTSSTGHSVTLNWAPSDSANIVGYYVYRMSLLDLSWAKLTASAVTGLKYTDTSVSAGETYYYAVTAVNSNGVQSGYSDQAIAIIP